MLLSRLRHAGQPPGEDLATPVSVGTRIRSPLLVLPPLLWSSKPALEVSFTRPEVSADFSGVPSPRLGVGGPGMRITGVSTKAYTEEWGDEQEDRAAS